MDSQLAGLAVGLGMMIAAVAASPGAAADKIPVSVGITNVVADVGMFIAHKRGYFAAETLDVKFIAFDAAARMITPLASGELDAGGGIAAGLFNAVARGVGLKIVADRSTSIPGFATAALMVRKDLVDSGRYKTPRDLKGFKLSVPAPGTGTSTSVSRMLATVGMTLADVNLVYLSFPNMITALANKAIDVGFLSEPGVTSVVASGTAVRLMSDDEMFPNHQIAVTLFSGRFMTAGGDAKHRFMRAFLRGTRDYVDVIKDGRMSGPGADAVIAILTEYSLIKDAEIYRRITVHGCDPDGRLRPESLETDLTFFKSQGLIQGKVEVADAIDPSIAAAAVRDLGPYQRK